MSMSKNNDEIEGSGKSIEMYLHASLTDRHTLSSHKIVHQHSKFATMQENATIRVTCGVGC